MASGEDWLLRPVLRHMCSYSALKDGSLDLFDIAVMCDALDVEDDNKCRIRELQNGQ